MSPQRRTNLPGFSKKNSCEGDSFSETLRRDNIMMKVSGDTAADVFSSNSTSFMKKSEEMGEILFKDGKSGSRCTESKSILPTISEKKYWFNLKSTKKV